jgi:hypothetical protein
MQQGKHEPELTLAGNVFPALKEIQRLFNNESAEREHRKVRTIPCLERNGALDEGTIRRWWCEQGLPPGAVQRKPLYDRVKHGDDVSENTLWRNARNDEASNGQCGSAGRQQHATG